MLKAKKIFITLLLLSCFLSPLYAEGEKESSLYYVKLGAIYPPGDCSVVLPSVGLGVRHQKDYLGYELSANLGSIVFLNYASLKAIGLIYPQPEKKHQLYVGVGPGIACYLVAIPMGQPYGSTSEELGMATVEAVIGYEFRHARYFKTFVQLEFSQPVYGFSEKGRHTTNYKPGVALTAGFGF